MNTMSPINLKANNCADALDGALNDTSTIAEAPARTYSENGKTRRVHFDAWGWCGDIDLPAYAIVRPHVGSASAIANAIARKNRLQAFMLRQTTYDERNARQLWVMTMGYPVGGGMSRVVTEVHFHEK